MRIVRCLLGSLLLPFLLSFGCASKDFREPEITDEEDNGPVARTFSRGFSDVWDAALETLSEKKYAVSVSKRDSGLLVTDWISGKSDRLFSGYGDTRIPYTVRFKLTLKFSSGRTGVRVLVTNDEQYLSDAITNGTDFAGSLYQWTGTPSSGVKEEALLEALSERLNALSAKGKK